ncbi:voltage gated chloride channel domain-containing protein [Cyclospora cayetanensis]|uniref:Voltage gated chloride channel domain-containing protein n=1 Tax=Cyclospora cayetanensis TaxID=88456 RepID=A0A1D3CXJ8_9EIME|nr:voltage gated chloride channel domain-containing protein [Cyclospora cayetanensis]
MHQGALCPLPSLVNSAFFRWLLLGCYGWCSNGSSSSSMEDKQASFSSPRTACPPRQQPPGVGAAAATSATGNDGMAASPWALSSELLQPQLPKQQPRHPQEAPEQDRSQRQQRSRGMRQHLQLFMRCIAKTPAFIAQHVLQHAVLLLHLLQLAATQVSKLEVWILAAATGIATAAAAVYIQLSSDFVADLRNGFCRHSFLKSQAACLAAVPEGFVGEGPWVSWASFFEAEGIADTKVFMRGFRDSTFLSPRVLVVKLLTLSLAVGSGLSLGKEGPMVHIACCVGFLLLGVCQRRVLTDEAALEASSPGLRAVQKTRSLSLNRRRHDHAQTLGPTDPDETTNAILLAACAAGVLGGVLGPVFVRLCMKWLRLHKAFLGSTVNPVAEAALVAAISAVVNHALPMMRHTSSVLLGPTLSDAYRVDASLALELCCVLLCKTLLTVFSFGLMVPAGIFIPALTIGASYGRLLGLLMLRLRPVFASSAASLGGFATPGAYALVGAVSFLGGVTQTNIALIVILIEVTKTSAALALPFLLSLAFAKLLSARAQQGGFYAALIRFKKQPFFFNEGQVRFPSQGAQQHSPYAYTLSNPHVGLPSTRVPACSCVQVCFDGLSAEEVMKKDVCVVAVDEGLTLASLKALADTCSFHGFPLVLSRSNKRLCGYLHAWQLRLLLQHLLLLEHPLVHAHTLVSFYAFRSAVTVAGGVPLQQRQQKLQEKALRSSVSLLILDQEGGLLQALPLLQMAADGRLRIPPVIATAAVAAEGGGVACKQAGKLAAAVNCSTGRLPAGCVEMQPQMDPICHPSDRNTAATEGCGSTAVGEALAGHQVFVDLSLLVDEEVLQLPPHTPLLHVYRMFGLLQCETCLISRCGVLEGLIGRKSFLTTMRTPQLDECC